MAFAFLVPNRSDGAFALCKQGINLQTYPRANGENSNSLEDCHDSLEPILV